MLTRHFPYLALIAGNPWGSQQSAYRAQANRSTATPGSGKTPKTPSPSCWEAERFASFRNTSAVIAADLRMSYRASALLTLALAHALEKRRVVEEVHCGLPLPLPSRLDIR